jgi:hypothetical protein
VSSAALAVENPARIINDSISDLLDIFVIKM